MQSKIPVINMIQESVNYSVHRYDNVKRVGIMATDGTIGSKIYHKACRKAGVTPVQPSAERQADVMSLIYDDIKAGKSGDRAKFVVWSVNLCSKGCEVSSWHVQNYPCLRVSMKWHLFVWMQWMYWWKNPFADPEQSM